MRLTRVTEQLPTVLLLTTAVPKPCRQSRKHLDLCSWTDRLYSPPATRDQPEQRFSTQLSLGLNGSVTSPLPPTPQVRALPVWEEEEGEEEEEEEEESG